MLAGRQLVVDDNHLGDAAVQVDAYAVEGTQGLRRRARARLITVDPEAVVPGQQLQHIQRPTRAGVSGRDTEVPAIVLEVPGLVGPGHPQVAAQRVRNQPLGRVLALDDEDG